MGIAIHRSATRENRCRIWIILPAVLLIAATTAPLAGADPFLASRQAMIANHIAGRGIRDPRVLEAMGKIPRHAFLRASQQAQAYADHPLPIDEGQTISQPYVVALMTELLQLKPSDRVLEIGTGSGYQAAVLAEIVGEVYSIEIRAPLAEQAAGRLSAMGYDRLKVKHGDGYFGWEEFAPFDAIIITAATNHIPPPLIAQLREGGRLILPLGSTTFHQTLTLITKEAGGELAVEQKGEVVFVPMTGQAGGR